MAEALKVEGNVHVAAKKWEKALECYSQALTLVDESNNMQKAVLLSNRSWCLPNLNRLKEAVEDGQLCIKLQPDWSKSYLRCAQAYSKQCNYAYAKPACESRLPSLCKESLADDVVRMQIRKRFELLRLQRSGLSTSLLAKLCKKAKLVNSQTRSYRVQSKLSVKDIIRRGFNESCMQRLKGISFTMVLFRL